MTLTKAEIKNFQSHKDTTIEFHEGVNAVVGLSDSGKSALYKALKWCITNKPAGDSFRRYDTTYTGVMLSFSDGISVLREKNKKDNTYVVYQDDNEQEYKAFKSDIPADVANALNIGQLNYQNQIDTPFLLGDSSSDVAKTLNQIVKLDEIDISQSNIRKKLLNQQSEKKRHLSNISVAEEKLKEFDDLDALEETVEEHEAILTELGELEQYEEGLVKIVNNYKIYNNELQEFKDIDKMYELHDATLSVFNEVNALSSTYNNIVDKLEQIDEANESVVEYDVDEANSLVNTTLNLTDELKDMKDQSKALNKLVKQYKEAITTKDKTTQQLKEHEEQYHQEFPDICPLCENPTRI